MKHTITGWWWLEPWNFMTFHSVGNGIIIPTDELIFFRGVGIPPTRYGFGHVWNGMGQIKYPIIVVLKFDPCEFSTVISGT
jgi:hypothetical protein